MRGTKAIVTRRGPEVDDRLPRGANTSLQQVWKHFRKPGSAREYKGVGSELRSVRKQDRLESPPGRPHHRASANHLRTTRLEVGHERLYGAAGHQNAG